MSKPATNRFFPAARSWAVRMVFDHQAEHPSQWAAINSIAGKIRLHGRDAAELGAARRAGSGPARRPHDGGWRPDQGARTRELRVAPSQLDPAQGVGVFCPGGARPPTEAMLAFIDDQHRAYGVEPICKVLPIAPSTYHAHAARRADPAKLSLRSKRDLVLTGDIQRVFDANFGVDGVRKVWRQLGREGKRGPVHNGPPDAQDGADGFVLLDAFAVRPGDARQHQAADGVVGRQGASDRNLRRGHAAAHHPRHNLPRDAAGRGEPGRNPQKPGRPGSAARRALRGLGLRRCGAAGGQPAQPRHLARRAGPGHGEAAD